MSNVLLNNPDVNIIEIRKYFELTDNKNKIYVKLMLPRLNSTKRKMLVCLKLVSSRSIL